MAMHGLVAAALIVKNEQANLRECLKSVKPYVDQIVVVDTGSDDATMNEILDFGAIPGYFPWCNDFSAARNACLEICDTDWILSIDADERLDPDSGKAMRKLLKAHPEKRHDKLLPLYGLWITNASDRVSQESQTSFWGIRLFPRHPKLRWTRRIHERISHDDGDDFLLTEFRPDIKLLHLGYMDAAWTATNKAARNVELAKLAVSENPEDASIWMDLGRGYYQIEDYRNCAGAMRTSLRLIYNQGLQSHPWTSIPYLLLISSLGQTHQFSEAMQTALAAIKAHPHHAGIANNAGLAMMDLGNPKSALAMFQRALGLAGKPSPYEQDDALGVWRAHLNIGNAYRAMGESVLAIESYKRASDAEPRVIEPALSAATLLLSLGEAGEAEKYAILVDKHQPGNPQAKLIASRVEAIRKGKDPTT
jgi:tetratricopeptide (TPR) repeat protein